MHPKFQTLRRSVVLLLTKYIDTLPQSTLHQRPILLSALLQVSLNVLSHLLNLHPSILTKWSCFFFSLTLIQSIKQQPKIPTFKNTARRHHEKSLASKSTHRTLALLKTSILLKIPKKILTTPGLTFFLFSLSLMHDIFPYSHPKPLYSLFQQQGYKNEYLLQTKIHTIAPRYFIGRYSYFISGSLLDTGEEFVTTVKEKDLAKFLIYKRTSPTNAVPFLYQRLVNLHGNFPAPPYTYRIKFTQLNTIHSSQPTPFSSIAQHAQYRLTLFKHWNKNFGNSLGANFILAIVHGQHHSDGLRFIAQRFGLSHLLAISGMHVFALCSLITFLLRLPLSMGMSWRGQHAKNPTLILQGVTEEFVVTLLLFIYCLWISYNQIMPSVIRAFLTRIIWLSYQVLQRRYDAINTWGLALTLHALFFPKQLLTISCALSYAATFALVKIYPHLMTTQLPSKLFSVLPPHTKDRLYFNGFTRWGFKSLRALHELTMAQMAIYTLCLPLILTFSPLPLIAIPINCLFTPLVLMLFPALVILFMLHPLIPNLLQPLCMHLVTLFDYIFLALADLPRTMDSTISLKLSPTCAAIYLLCIFLYFLLSPVRPKKTILSSLSKIVTQNPI